MKKSRIKRNLSLLLSGILFSSIAHSANLPHEDAPHSGGHGAESASPWNHIEWQQTMRTLPKGDPIKGAQLASQAYCYACHGAEGVNQTQSTPSLAGQNAVYTYKMLLDYQTGRFNLDRKSEVMIDLMQGYDKQALADLAAYFQAQPIPSGTYAAQSTAYDQQTVRLVTKGDVSRMITPCASCHGAKGEGGMNETPALSALSPRMFVRQMKAYRSGKRDNDVHQGMAQFAKNLTDDEISNLANYYATFMIKE